MEPDPEAYGGPRNCQLGHALPACNGASVHAEHEKNNFNSLTPQFVRTPLNGSPEPWIERCIKIQDRPVGTAFDLRSSFAVLPLNAPPL